MRMRLLSSERIEVKRFADLKALEQSRAFFVGMNHG